MKHFFHGADYNPEQWLESPEILRQDIAWMKQAQCNVMSMGMFSWSMLEPEEGDFQLDYLAKIIDDLYKNGISTILSTPSGARPPWLAQVYPEVLCTDEQRRKNLFGARHNHCFTSPVYREKVKRINQALAQRLGHHPGVVLWHISNEYSAECHCPLCQDAFRLFLQKRYGTLNALNNAWNTRFWSHVYSDWAQIESPSSIGESSLHGLHLDWRRFVSEQNINFFCHERDAVRELIPDAAFTTNMMYYFNTINYFALAKELDIASWDSYPVWHKANKTTAELAYDTAFWHDLQYSLKHKPFLLMESTPSQTNWQSVSKLKKPGMHLLSSLQAVAHGSDSVQYFQWRKSIGASEKFHGAVIDHRNTCDTRTFREVQQVGEWLSEHRVLAGAQRHSEIAIVYDWENKWAMEHAQGPRNCGLGYKEEVLLHYRGLRESGHQINVVDESCDISCYKVVIAPMLYLLTESFAQQLKAFVESGGTLVATHWSGIVNEADCCYLGNTPHGLTDVLGLYREETDALYDGEVRRCVATNNNPTSFLKEISAQTLCELVQCTTAVPLYLFDEDFFKGKPAITCNSFGAGTAYFLCARFDASFYYSFYQEFCTEVAPVISSLPQGVLASKREQGEQSFVILQNYNKEATTITAYGQQYVLQPYETKMFCDENKL